jgi:hypothetical protein
MADIPLHDVWVLHLPGGGSATLDDLAEVFSSFSPLQGSPAIFLLGGLREVVGLAFGWEEDRWDDPESSYVSRLGEVDRAASSVEPGTEFGRWRVVYSFPQEAMVETINGTVHASVTCGLEPDRSGSNLYLAFHVREVNWSTRFYMALIDPYRRYFVYPHLLNQFEHTWEREKGGAVTP